MPRWVCLRTTALQLQAGLGCLIVVTDLINSPWAGCRVQRDQTFNHYVVIQTFETMNGHHTIRVSFTCSIHCKVLLTELLMTTYAAETWGIICSRRVPAPQSLTIVKWQLSVWERTQPHWPLECTGLFDVICCCLSHNWRDGPGLHTFLAGAMWCVLHLAAGSTASVQCHTRHVCLQHSLPVPCTICQWTICSYYQNSPAPVI